MPQHPLAAVADGAASGVDLLIGTNRDELTLFGLGNPALMALDADGVRQWMANAVPDIPADEVLDSYRAARQSREERVEPRDLWVAAGTDIVFRWPSLQLAATHGGHGGRSFVYLFDWESPAFEGILGSCHALELPFVFGVVHEPAVQMFSGSGPEVETLSRNMQAAWLAFARDGDPVTRRDRRVVGLGARVADHHDVRPAHRHGSGTAQWRARSAGAASAARGERLRLSLLEPKGEMADAGVAVAARPHRWPGQPERFDAAEQLLERDADLQAGQVGAQAEVDAVTE